MLLVQPVHQLDVIRQYRSIQFHALHNLIFKVGLAFQDPAGNFKQGGGFAAQQQEEGLMQGVELDERSVKVDTKRYGFA